MRNIKKKAIMTAMLKSEIILKLIENALLRWVVEPMK